MAMRRALLLFLAAGLAGWAQGDVPFGFEPNTGDLPAEVRFARRSTSNPIFITRDAMVLRGQVQVQIADVPAGEAMEGDSPSPVIYNFYEGGDPSRWRVNVRLFDAVRLNQIYPGVSARFSLAGGQPARARLTLLVQPGADLERFRLRVLGTGAAPKEGPDGIWFEGGTIPGVFPVGVQAFQMQNGARVPLGAKLKIDSPEVLRVEAPERNVGAPLEVLIEFPSYDLPAAISPGTDRLRTAVVNQFRRNENCTGPAVDTALARFDFTGTPVWITVFGGTCEDWGSFARATGDGISVAGTTNSKDFPISPNAMIRAPGGANDVFFANFDGENGKLRNATYAGLEGTSRIQEAVAGPGVDLAAGGGHSASVDRGFLIRWRPAENRFLYFLRVDAPVRGIALDAPGNLYFATAGSQLQAGMVSPDGRIVGKAVTVAESQGAQPNLFEQVQLQPGADGDVWLTYAQRANPVGRGELPLMVAKVSPARGEVAVKRVLAGGGLLTDAGLTAAGNLKLLVRGAPLTEQTTGDAPLAAGCIGSSYFAVLSPKGGLVHATYVPGSEFQFAVQQEPVGPPLPRLGCVVSTAGRTPLLSVAPGQLITVTGGGFGPATPVFYAPDASGKYPVEAGGFRVRVGGMDAPILAIARGLIAAQVPYELGPSSRLDGVDLIDRGTVLLPVPIRIAAREFRLFDTGDRSNVLGLPALAALNQDGTVNSSSNPAADGSVVSLFGSGLGEMAPKLATGGLSPVPPAGPLSRSTLLRKCLGCEILYLGSAPGLSTSVAQINVRVSAPGEGLRPHGIGIAVGASPQDLIIFSPAGVVFVK